MNTDEWTARKAAFHRKWKHHLAALALYGMHTETTKGPLARASHAFEVVDSIESLLDDLFSDLIAKPAVIPEQPKQPEIRPEQPKAPVPQPRPAIQQQPMKGTRA